MSRTPSYTISTPRHPGGISTQGVPGGTEPALILFKNFPFREILLSPFFTVYRYAMHYRGIAIGRERPGVSHRICRRGNCSVLSSRRRPRDSPTSKSAPSAAGDSPQSQDHIRAFRELVRRFSMSAEEVALKE
jgi:hypothetical protein